MQKIRFIRTQNTLLAAFGGILLSLIIVFGLSIKEVPFSREYVLAAIVIFWCVNGAFILMVMNGYSERFSDPSLSLPQMYWAGASSLASLLIIPDLSYLVYFLIFLVAIFGVFRLRPSTFVFYAFFQSFCLALIFYLQIQLNLGVYQDIELLATWLVFSCCMVILTTLCRSMSLLRQKLKRRNQELSEALQSKSQFLANVSHEIRTPMNGVIGMLELLNKDELTLNQQRYLGIAKSSGESLVILINDVLDFSKIEAGKLELDMSDFDIKSVIFGLSHSFYYLAHRKGLDFSLMVDPQIPSLIRADEIRIRQIINNLLGNAMKFTAEGSISVSAFLIESNNSMCTIGFEVEDSGIGIEKEAMPKVFESFSQADNSTTRQFGGTGLGLAISQKLCGYMGGEISLTSELGKGSIFSFQINVEVILESKAPGALINERVLLIDHYVSRVNALEKNIRFLSGEAHIMAKSLVSVDDVLAEVIDYKITTLIIHHSVNSNTGLALARHIRNLPGLLHIRVLLLVPDLPEGAVLGKVYFLDDLYTLDNLFTVLSDMNAESCKENSESILNSNKHASKMKEKECMNNVLLVEDNDVNQEVAEMLLEDCEVNVLIAGDGQQALDLLLSEDSDIQLIFMDCQMPVMDGYQATKAIRSGAGGERYKTIPIVAMTANALAGDKEKCLDVGMDDYISKPINFEALEAAVKKWTKSL